MGFVELATLLVLFALPLAALLILGAVLIRDLRRTYLPARLIAAGRFAEARALSEKPWWLKWIPSVRLASDYNAALCLMLEGRPEESLPKFQALSDESLPGNLSEGVANSLGTNLLLLGREPEQAQRWLELACASTPTPSDRMSLALAMSRSGDPRAAEEAQRAELTADKRLTLGVKVVLVHPEELERSCFALMRGLFLLERGDPKLARPDLERAAASSVQSLYKMTATQLMEQVPAAQSVEAEPSTLSPHVLAGR